MPAPEEIEVEEVKYAMGVQGDENSQPLYVVGDKIGNCSGYYVVREGYRGGDYNLALVTFVTSGDEQKRALERLGRAEAALSDEACFAHVLRYKDYIGNENAADATDVNKARPSHPDLYNSLVTARADWEGFNLTTGVMSHAEILDVAWDMLQALAYLHGRGVVHGSVEPRHILRLPGRPPGAERGEMYKLIGHGLVPGVLRYWSFTNAAYVAPELRRRGKVTVRVGEEYVYKPTMASDMWMLGQVLFDLHERSISGVLEDRNSTGAGCSDCFHQKLEQLLERMLQNSPGRRYTAMNALVWLAEERITLHEAGDVRGQIGPVKDAIKKAKHEMRMRTVRGRAWVGFKGFIVSLFLVQMFALGMGVF